MKVIVGQPHVQGHREETNVKDESPVGSNSSNSFKDRQEMLTEAVFSNALILDKILDFYPSPKTFRLVAKSWNDIALSRKPRLVLKLCTISYSCEDSEEFESPDCRLVKRLSLNVFHNMVGRGNLAQRQQASQGPTWLIHICAKFGSNVQKLSIRWGIAIVPTLYHVFCSVSTPNLKILLITIEEGSEESLSVSLQRKIWPRIRSLPKLEEIHFHCWAVEEKDRIQIFSLISPFFSDLLAAAPKLKTLEVSSFFCHCLEGNKELKTFRFYSTMENIFPGEENGRSSIPCYNMNHLTQILGVVKDSLETFKVGYRFRKDTLKNLKIGTIPPMRRLEVFINGGSDVGFGINCNMRDLAKERMPSLKRLEISFVVPPTRGNIMRQIVRLRNDGIRRLGLIHVDEDNVVYLSRLKNRFPSLERLDLLLQEDDDENEAYLGEWVGTVLKSCSGLGLRHLRVKTGFNYLLSGMVEALWECREEFFSGLKTLELINHHKYREITVNDDLGRSEQLQFQQVLILTKEMERVIFQGFVLRAGHATRVSKFISDNQLPIKFLDEDDE